MSKNWLKWLRLLSAVAMAFADGKITKDEAARIVNLVVELIFEDQEK